MLDPDRSNPPLDDNSAPAPTVELSDAEVDALVSSIAPRVQKENERIGKELPLLAERTLMATNASGAVIALVSGDALICRGCAGDTAPEEGTRLDPRTGLSGECVRTGGILLCDDCESDERVDANSCRALGIRSVLVVPLYRIGEVIGVFEVFSPERQAFDHQDIAVLQTMAEMVVDVVYPPTAQQASRVAEKLPEMRPAAVIPTAPKPAPRMQASAQDVGIDLSKLIVEPEEGSEEGSGAAVLEFPAAAPKKPPTHEELAPIHDPQDDLVCELGPERIADLLQAPIEESTSPGLKLFHPAEEVEAKRPAISRKLLVAAGVVVVVALVWLKFCNHAEQAAPESQSSETPVMEAPAPAIEPVAPAPVETVKTKPKAQGSERIGTSTKSSPKKNGEIPVPKKQKTEGSTAAVSPMSNVTVPASLPKNVSADPATLPKGPSQTQDMKPGAAPIRQGQKPWDIDRKIQAASDADHGFSVESAEWQKQSPVQSARNTKGEEVAELVGAAQQGNPRAELALGVRYAEGDGVRQDYYEAVRWFTQAAAQGLKPTDGKAGHAWKRTTRWLKEHEKELAQSR